MSALAATVCALADTGMQGARIAAVLQISRGQVSKLLSARAVEDVPPAPVAIGCKSRQAWSREDIANMQTWRDQTPPVSFVEIGQRLGRKPEVCRQRLLYADACRRMGTAPRGDPSHGPIERSGTSRPNLKLCDAVMAGGGMSRPVLVEVRGATAVVLLAPNGVQRPAGWRDGMPETSMNRQHLNHLKAVRAWWSQERRRMPDTLVASGVATD